MTGTRLTARPVQGRGTSPADGHGMGAFSGFVADPLPGAACPTSGLPADTWFGGPQLPTGAYVDKDGADQAARAVCFTCPAVAPCLQRALDLREQFGVFGGFTAEGRRNIRRGRTGGGVAEVVAEIEYAGGDAAGVLRVVRRHRARGAA